MARGSTSKSWAVIRKHLKNRIRPPYLYRTAERILSSGLCVNIFEVSSRCSGLERLHFFDAATGVAVTFNRYVVDSLADQRFDVHCAFGPIEFFGRGVQCGVAWQEDGAAIVERFGRDGVCADFLRGSHDFELVVARERTVQGDG